MLPVVHTMSYISETRNIKISILIELYHVYTCPHIIRLLFQYYHIKYTKLQLVCAPKKIIILHNIINQETRLLKIVITTYG